MAVFIVFWISPAVNSTKSFKYLAEKGYCWFLEPFAMLFMQLKGRSRSGRGDGCDYREECHRLDLRVFSDIDMSGTATVTGITIRYRELAPV